MPTLQLSVGGLREASGAFQGALRTVSVRSPTRSPSRPCCEGVASQRALERLREWRSHPGLIRGAPPDVTRPGARLPAARSPLPNAACALRAGGARRGGHGRQAGVLPQPARCAWAGPARAPRRRRPMPGHGVCQRVQPGEVRPPPTTRHRGRPAAVVVSRIPRPRRSPPRCSRAGTMR